MTYIQKQWANAKSLLDKHYNEFTLLPEEDRTLLLPLDARVVYRRLLAVSYNKRDKIAVDKQLLAFFGDVWHEGFVFSHVFGSPQWLKPVIKGRIESTRHGSIVFVSYRLSLTCKAILWSFMLFWAALLVFLGFMNSPYLSTLCLPGCFLNYFLMMIFLKDRKRLAHQCLLGSLWLEKK